jgi:HTH-type transcriptional regulator / antitoxin HipB
MDDLEKYIERRKKRSKNFASTFELGYHEFKIGAILKRAREESGLTQNEVALKLKTKKTAISRIENHAEDIKLSTIERFAHAVGKEIKLQVV